MTWLHPASADRDLVDQVAAQNTALYRLALVLAPALRIEPLLLRNARLRFLPQSDAGIESDLWFSPLVSARSARSVLLRPGVARVLADRLEEADSPFAFAEVWQFIVNQTASWPFEDRLEQGMRQFARRGDMTALRDGLRGALRRITGASGDGERRDLARWLKGALPALGGDDQGPAELDLAAALAAAALGDPGGTLGRRMTSGQALPDWLRSFVPSGKASELGLRLWPGILEVLPPDDAGIRIDLGAPSPALVHIQCEQQTERRGHWEPCWPGRRIPLPAGCTTLTLTTLSGARYQLAARPAQTPPAEANAAVFDRPAPGHDQIFVSYNRNDLDAAVNLRAQLEKRGLSVVKDDQSIREGDQWLTRLQEAVDGCTGFVVLVGRDGVGRWIGAETQVALIRYFGPHDDTERLPIFPILLGDTAPESLPAFLRLFQATRWNGSDPLPERLLDQIHKRTIVPSEEAVFEGCPYVGLAAFRQDQAQLFFGRQKETLEALACFDTRRGRPAVRWLEINGISGSGKSSLLNAGLLPLVDQGWLWTRTGHRHWRLIGPMTPGKYPVRILAESLARFSREVLKEQLAMVDFLRLLEADDRGLADWLRSRNREETAFLLAIDQFEELFTLADRDERQRFDRVIATALAETDCRLFVISAIRRDFLDQLERLPRLVELRNRLAQSWTLPPIDDDGLREVIGGPARLAGLDVTEVQEAIVADAREEPAALPLVQIALRLLWEEREGNRLSRRKYFALGRLAGIPKRSGQK